MVFRLLHPLALFATLAVVAGAQESSLAGKFDGENYVSPTGEFKIAAPVLPELGGVITDTENVVTFSDSFNTHLSIACFPLDASQKWELDTRGRRDYLLYFFTTFVLPDFQGRFPGSSIESARFLPDLQDGSLITFSLLPGGSAFEDKNKVLDAAPPVNPVTAKRGTLLFIRHHFIYVISSELAERATQRSTYHKTVEQENQLLSERLITLTGRFVFTGEKTTQP
jgi:hypothetical protein